MKKLILLFIVFGCLKMNAQTYGGEIQAKDNSGTIGKIRRNSNHLLVNDSTLVAKFFSQGSTTSGQVGPLIQGAVSTSNPSYTNAQTSPLSLTTDGKLRVNATLSGTTKPVYGSTTSMTVTNLNSLANSSGNGWQSARVSNLSTLATDYEINVKLTMANTAPANDKAAYVFIVPFYTSDGGTTWFASSQGTTTLPTGTEGTTTIATPNNLRLLGILNYTTQNMVLQDTWLLSNAFGNAMPDGFSIIIIDFTGAAVSGSGNVVQYTPLNTIIQ